MPASRSRSPLLALEVADVTVTFGGVKALDRASLAVASGSVHCLVGGNGSGKSTLLKVLAGVYRASPDGSVIVAEETIAADGVSPGWARHVGLRFVHQDLAVFPEISVAENLALGVGYPCHRTGNVSWKRLHQHAREVLDRFGIAVDPTIPVARLRPADRTLLAIARALQDQQEGEGAQRHILVLDEPTAALPEADASTLLTQLKAYAAAGQTIILVSHRLDEVLAVADQVTALRDGKVLGTFARDQIDHDDLVRLITGASPVESTRVSGAPGEVVLRATGLRGRVLNGVDLTLRSGEILGIAGIRGSGRSELLRLLGRVQQAAAGSITTSATPADTSRNGFGPTAYLPEDRDADAGFPELSLRENLLAGAISTCWRRIAISRRREAAVTSDLVNDFLIKASGAEQPMATLSGGNRQKVVLARLMHRRPQILLLDEPSQGVDVGARAEIHRIMHKAVDEGAGVIVVSSDLEELVSLSDRVLVLVDGRIVADLSGKDLTVARATTLAHRLGDAA
jgi:ribose transport system ATP-binding protein